MQTRESKRMLFSKLGGTLYQMKKKAVPPILGLLVCYFFLLGFSVSASENAYCGSGAIKNHRSEPSLATQQLHNLPFDALKEIVSSLPPNSTQASLRQSCKSLHKFIDENIWVNQTLNIRSLPSVWLSSLPFKSLWIAPSLSIGIEGILEITKFTQLTSLCICFNSVKDKGAQEITSKLINLTALDMNYCDVGAEGVTGISKLINLISLGVEGRCDNNQEQIGKENSLGIKGAREIVKLTNLTSLDASYQYLGDEGISIITQLTKLKSLRAGCNQLGEEGLRMIATLTNLTSLDVGDNQLQDNKVREIAKLTNLKELWLDWRNQLSTDGIREIAKISGLELLMIGGQRIGDGELQELNVLTKLTTLYLQYKQLNPTGIRELNKFPDLTFLDVSGNNLRPEVGKELAKLINLTSLTVSDNLLGNEGAQELTKLTNLTTLRFSMNRIESQITKEIKDRFLKRRPGMVIHGSVS